MAIRNLERFRWQAYFDLISRELLGKRAEIEVASLALGSQVAAEWVAVLGITYEPRAATIRIMLDGLDHPVPHPQDVYVDEGPAGLANVEITDASGTRHIIRLREPLMLSAPSPTAG